MAFDAVPALDAVLGSAKHEDDAAAQANVAGLSARVADLSGMC